ncbi:MAG TPA: ATP-binding protein [Rhizomicrobium sp.]|nr:ATP-binding protein [Rhizomicrobium sp.]
MKVWPRTLGAQLIVVTALAVLISNAGVAMWFAATRESETQRAQVERRLDRAVSVATLLSSIPAKERETAARTMSVGLWRFRLRYGKLPPEPMTQREQALAERVRALLPPERARQPVAVHLRMAPIGDEHLIRLRGGQRVGPVMEIVLPVVRNTDLVVTYFVPPPAPWPFQIAIAAIAAIVLTSLAAALVASRMTRPLRELAAAASVAARGGAAHHVSEVGPEDIHRAAHAFNAMTDQVRRTLESHRQLLSAVGHDLRTPITAMRISTEFVEDAEVRERLEKNLTELQELTEAVLEAARGAGWEQMRKIDLAALIESLCADLEEMGKPVTWTIHAAAPLTCRPNEIRRAVRNLIENAIAYGRTADVRLNASPTAYEIVVDDQGPGIPGPDLARVFEPFVRLETSRSPETGGSGLGLTLVKAIAEGHGGSIALENRPEGGLRARLYLPREA